MGSDRSPAYLFKAIEQAVQEFPQVYFVVFVTQAALDEILLQTAVPFPVRNAHLEFQVVTDVVEMHDEPLVAIRRKKNSSLALGIKLLKKRVLDGFVSAGNTGALIAGATVSSPFPGLNALRCLLPCLPKKGLLQSSMWGAIFHVKPIIWFNLPCLAQPINGAAWESVSRASACSI